MSGVADEPSVIGIDIGGSKTHGIHVRGATVMREAFSGTANISSVGPAEAARQLELLASRLLDGTSGRVTAVCAGAAGADTPGAEQRVNVLLERIFPGVPIQVVHDAQLVLAAADLHAGVALIAGTGSVAWGLNEAGDVVRAGGWGYLLGDAGGGFGVVRAAIQHTLGLDDAGLPADELARQVLAVSGARTAGELLERFYSNPSRRIWAERADIVFTLAAKDDRVAQRIVSAAAADLVQAAVQVCRRLGIPGPVVMAGGLVVHQPLLREAVRAELAAHGLADIRLLERDPVYGAVVLAQGLAVTS